MSKGCFTRLIVTTALWLLCAFVLAGCAEAKSTVDVNVHGVNYSGTTFSYYLIDPVTQKNEGVGELIDPFAAGGTTCCFSLPKIWRPGIKVQVHATHWLPKLPDSSLPEVKKVHVVDVPRYAENKPGELWIMRSRDGSISVISSDFQPDHPQWPGTPKGWPVPSLEYRRERWELIRAHEESVVDVHVSLLHELKNDPQKRTLEAWQFSEKHEPELLKNFSGPDDVRFYSYLKDSYTRGLERSQMLLKRVMEARP